MNGTWAAVVGGILTILGAYIAARTAGRATVKAAETAAKASATVAAASADEGAYIRAKEIFEAGIDEQADRITRIVSDLTETRNTLGTTVLELADTRKELKTARDEIATLRRSVSQYEGRVIQLTEVLRLHKIDVPPWTLNPSDYGILPGSIPDPNQPARTNPDDH